MNLPTHNIRATAQWENDAFSLAKLLRTNAQEEEKEFNDLVQFWNEAYNHHSRFAKYYGGENMAWTLVDLGLFWPVYICRRARCTSQ